MSLFTQFIQSTQYEFIHSKTIHSLNNNSMHSNHATTTERKPYQVHDIPWNFPRNFGDNFCRAVRHLAPLRSGGSTSSGATWCGVGGADGVATGGAVRLLAPPCSTADGATGCGVDEATGVATAGA